MNATARAKMLITLSLDENGFADIERVRAVCDYVINKVETSQQIEVLKEYVKQLRSLLLKQTATIETSANLSKETLEELIKKIKARMGKSVKVETKVNEKLLGGIRITCGDDIFERSVADKFNTLAQSCKIR